jgi:aspartate aminotransferase-like enzyme
MSRPYRLLAPGPVPVPPLVMQKMSEKVIHHRTPEFEKILVETWSGLQHVFQTRQPVQILCGTGSAAMEAAVVNLLSPGDEALVVVSGKFGERWAEICARYGVVVHKLEVEWGSPVAIAELGAKLNAHPKVKAVFSQVCETSTATLHPIEKMAALVKASGALFVVDAITAVGCMPLPMDAWGLDCVIAGSQKAFMIPTGLSFIALSERAWKAQGSAKSPKFYLDLALEKKANDKKETHFSTPTPLIVGLHQVLKRIQEVGLEQVVARCELLAGVTRTFGERLKLETFSRSPSSSVTALRTPSDSAALRDWLEKERNITIMGGQDHLKGKIIRIGHMGDVRDDDMLALFEALSEKLGGDFAAMKQDLALRLSAVRPLFT